MIILHNDVQDALRRMRNKQEVLIFLRRLQRYPATQGDHYELDLKGNPIQFKVLKRYVLVYFRDPFANETRVLDLFHTERV